MLKNTARWLHHTFFFYVAAWLVSAMEDLVQRGNFLSALL
jgi:hypothetical protein